MVLPFNDNNNFAPPIFRSLCEFIGDYFGLWYFSDTSVQNNHLQNSHNDLKKDSGVQLLLCN